MHSFKSIGLVLFSLAAVTIAAPPSYDARRISKCSLNGVKLPGPASALPAPKAAPMRVLLGVGTQNFTCADSKAETKPVATGAVADLYDASCIARNAGAFEEVTKKAYRLSLSSKNPREKRIRDMVLRLFAQSLRVGDHYFAGPGSAKFDFAVTKPNDYFLGVKKNNIPSPQGTTVNADWLLLESTDTTTAYKSVYRVVTQGGIAPTSCKDAKGDIKVPYAAQYFLY